MRKLFGGCRCCVQDSLTDSPLLWCVLLLLLSCVGMVAFCLEVYVWIFKALAYPIRRKW
jgi:hypothetical protein